MHATSVEHDSKRAPLSDPLAVKRRLLALALAPYTDCYAATAQSVSPCREPAYSFTFLVRSKDGVCPCTCDYVADASCTCRDLAGALNVTLSKSGVYASYPLQYVQTFNYKPYEVSLYERSQANSAARTTWDCR